MPCFVRFFLFLTLVTATGLVTWLSIRKAGAPNAFPVPTINLPDDIRWADWFFARMRHRVWTRLLFSPGDTDSIDAEHAADRRWCSITLSADHVMGWWQAPHLWVWQEAPRSTQLDWLNKVLSPGPLLDVLNGGCAVRWSATRLVGWNGEPGAAGW